ncbi:beta-ketoacyl-[acyl-carrier-protein] synthase family protein [Actinokineospora diospyrosa]|uniref:3-oxoacyl-[acyl-carrier-protein] synthase II n=1 Tax=Actinokineospora diospyrosa TaxID=103728 RepID=A0ABT1IAM2_9PSEU|nr:beta-ketoacyl synthase N-terminal-like domain-containing protein [Actinokineospora diospyrosa]MCP2269401.1 3-oxoacyl-[acyl-carrier-protein] synthase II [Actinokineospora diospyrosa]
MRIVVTGYDMVTGLGDLRSTTAGLFAGRTALGPLRFHDKTGVTHGYQIPDEDPEPSLRASRWLTRCVAGAAAAGLPPDVRRVHVVVGTGLRELRAVERWAVDGAALDPADLHFGRAVRRALPTVEGVHTVANACSASGHALAVGADMLVTGEADAVVVAGADAMTDSMLAMIARISDDPTTALRPFDRDRTGVLLGEGAAAVVLRPDAPDARAHLLSTSLTCDAFHETGPHLPGIVNAMRDAHTRAGITAEDIDLVVAHGTGTALNDPTEAAALTQVLGDRPSVTALKGALGHTSGAAALMNLIVAIESMHAGRVPAVAGLINSIPEAAGLRLVRGEPEAGRFELAQVNAFGFGGVNAVSVVGLP